MTVQGRGIEVIDRRRDYGEERIRAIGEIDGRIYVVIYTERPGIRWIITARKRQRKGSQDMAQQKMTLAAIMARSPDVDLSTINATTKDDIRRQMHDGRL